MKLEIKHIAPYPYGLKGVVYDNVNDEVFFNEEIQSIHLDESILTFIDASDVYLDCNEVIFKPILRPKTDMLKEQFQVLLYNEFGGGYKTQEAFNECALVEEKLNTPTDLIEYALIEFLCKHHFDIFDLIPNGLAIDINTLEK